MQICTIRVAKGAEGSSAPPKCLAYLVILCVEKRRPKQKYCCSHKTNHLGPPKILGWLQHWYAQRMLEQLRKFFVPETRSGAESNQQEHQSCRVLRWVWKKATGPNLHCIRFVQLKHRCGSGAQLWIRTFCSARTTTTALLASTSSDFAATGWSWARRRDSELGRRRQSLSISVSFWLETQAAWPARLSPTSFAV